VLGKVRPHSSPHLVTHYSSLLHHTKFQAHLIIFS
jgi:hypothetical protein